MGGRKYTLNDIEHEILRKRFKEPRIHFAINCASKSCPDLAAQVAEATSGAAIKLGIDAVGGDATARLGECLSNEGTLVNYGMMSGMPCTLSSKVIIFKDVTVKGFWLAKWFRTASKEQQMALYGDLTQRVAKGQLKAPIHQTFSVRDIKQAVATAAQGERNGKVLITQ